MRSMKFTKKRFIALGLALVLFVGAINLSAFQINAAIEPTYEATYTDDFSDSAKTFQYMEEAKLSGTYDEYSEGITNFIVEDDVLKQGMTNNSHRYCQYFTLKDDYLPDGAMVNHLSVDFTYSGYYDTTSDKNQNRIVAYYNPSTGQLVEFYYQYYAKYTNYSFGHAETEITADTTNTWEGQTTSAKATSYRVTEWTAGSHRCEINYNYIEGDEGAKVLQIIADLYLLIHDEGVETAKLTQVVNLPVDSFTGFKTGIKACTQATNVVTYDKFSLTYSGNKTDAQLAEEFRTRNEAILAKDSNDVTADDLDAYVAAMSDYESISEAAQVMVADEYAKLQEIYTIMQKNVADTFYAKHKEILDKQLTDIAVSDKTILFNALEDTQGLSDFETTALATYISDLESKKTKFYAVNDKVNGDDFEHKTYSNYYWTTENYTSDTSDDTVTYTDYTFEEDGDNTWFVPGNASKAHLNTIASDYWPTGRQLAEVSMDVYLPSTSSETTIFSYYDSSTNKCASFRIYYNSTDELFYSQVQSGEDALKEGQDTCTDGTYYKSLGRVPMNSGFTYGKTYTVKLTYSYLTGKDTGTKYVYVYCTFTDSEGTQVGYRHDLLTTDKWTDFKVGILCNKNAANYAKHDNVSFKFFNTEEDNKTLAAEFVSAHSEILNKTYSDLEETDVDVIHATLSAYDALDEAVKPYLSAEVERLNMHLLYLENLSVLGDIDTDDINSCLKAWRVFKGEKEAFRNYCLPLYQEIHQAIKDYDTENKATDEQIDIITVGHSMVYGQGATDASYPIQLQTMLDERYGTGAYEIVNDGVGGFKVANLLDEARKTHQESYNSDIVIITIGANDSVDDAFVENYNQLIDHYQSWQSAPTIIMTTDPYMANRPNDQRAEAIRSIAAEHELQLVDLFALTSEAYAEDLAALETEYKALVDSGVYTDEDEAIAAAETACFDKWFIEDGIHYQAYGYGKMAEYVFAALKNSYCDFNIPYADIKNVICYDNEWDDTYLTKVEALDSAIESLDTTDADAVTTCQESYNALSDIQKMKFESDYQASYIKLIDAINYDLANITAEGFRRDYSDISSISTVADYAAAQNAYDTLNDTAKRMLTEEKEQLDAVYATIKPQAIEQLVKAGVTDARAYTKEMLLAANSEMNTYNAAERLVLAESRKSILNTLKTTKTAYNENIKIFCAGDSITYGVRDAHMNPVPYTNVLNRLLGEGYHVYNGGCPSAGFYGAHKNYNDPSFNEHYEYAAEYQPDIVILMLGTNDAVVRKYTTEENCAKGGDAYNEYVELIQYFQGLESAPQVIVATVPWCSYITKNSAEAYYNSCVSMQKAVAEEYGLPMIDMAALTADWPAYKETIEKNYELSDGLHYTAIAYEAMAEHAYSVVKDIAPEQIYGYLKSVPIESAQNLYQAFLDNKCYETADAYLAIYNNLSDTLKANYSEEIQVINAWLKSQLISDGALTFDKAELSNYSAVLEHVWSTTGIATTENTKPNTDIYNTTDVTSVTAVFDKATVSGRLTSTTQDVKLHVFSDLKETTDGETAINDFGPYFAANSTVTFFADEQGEKTATVSIPVVRATATNLDTDSTNIVYKSTPSYGNDLWDQAVTKDTVSAPLSYADYKNLTENAETLKYLAVQFEYVATEEEGCTRIDFVVSQWVDDGDGVYEEGVDVLVLNKDRAYETAYLKLAYSGDSARTREFALTGSAYNALEKLVIASPTAFLAEYEDVVTTADRFDITAYKSMSDDAKAELKAEIDVFLVAYKMQREMMQNAPSVDEAYTNVVNMLGEIILEETGENPAVFEETFADTLALDAERLAPYDIPEVEAMVDVYNAFANVAGNVLASETIEKVNLLREARKAWNITSDAAIITSYQNIWGDKLTTNPEAAWNVYNRLTAEQKALLSEEYTTLVASLKENIQQEDDSINVYCLGDSITKGEGSTNWITDSYPVQLGTKLGEAYSVTGFGYSGFQVQATYDSTDQVELQWQTEAPEKWQEMHDGNADIVIIQLGTNDLPHVIAHNGQELYKKALEELIQSFLKLENSPYVILSNTPMDYKRFTVDDSQHDIVAKLNMEVAAKYGLPCVDIHAYTVGLTAEEQAKYYNSDKLHFTTDGYDMMSDIFKNAITSLKTEFDTANVTGFNYDDSKLNSFLTPQLFSATIKNETDPTKQGLGFKTNINEYQKTGTSIVAYGTIFARYDRDDNYEDMNLETVNSAENDRYFTATIRVTDDSDLYGNSYIAGVNLHNNLEFSKVYIARSFIEYADGSVYYSINTRTDLESSLTNRVGVVDGYACRALTGVAKNMIIALYNQKVDIQAVGTYDSATGKLTYNDGVINNDDEDATNDAKPIFELICAYKAKLDGSANTVYLASTGSDGNLGTEASPYLTLSKALAVVPDGGTIEIMDDCVLTSNFVWKERNKAVTIIGQTSEVQLDFTNMSNDIVIGNDVTFDDITLTFEEYDNFYANGHKLVIGEGVTTENLINVYGGGTSETTVENTDVTLLSGSYLYIYGGSNAGTVQKDTKLTIGGNVNPGDSVATHDETTSRQRIYAGGYNDTIGGNTYCTLTDSAQAYELFGGSRGETAQIAGVSNIEVNAGAVYAIIGGNDKSSVILGTNVTVNGGSIAQVLGGNQAANMGSDTTKATINVQILGGTITRRIYGGCYNEVSIWGDWDSSYHVNGNINLTISGNATLSLNTETDNGFYVCSRYKEAFDEEVCTIIYKDAMGYNNYQSAKGNFTYMKGVSPHDHETYLYA